jgi:hypothetical protein
MMVILVSFLDGVYRAVVVDSFPDYILDVPHVISPLGLVQISKLQISPLDLVYRNVVVFHFVPLCNNRTRLCMSEVSRIFQWQIVGTK